MHWENTTSKMPDDGEEVLIRVETIVHLATYDESENVFRLRTGEVVGPIKHLIEWMRLSTPEHKV